MDEKVDDFQTMSYILRRPGSLFPCFHSLETVLALIHGVALERYPPHGSGFLPGFGEFVGLRFGAPSINHYITLVQQFGWLPLYEGCREVLKLLEEWKTNEEFQSART